jgi:hypothetical protein
MSRFLVFFIIKALGNYNKTSCFCNAANCIIKNLYEIDSLHHLKIYTKESCTVSVKAAGGSNEVNGKRETESDKDHSGTISESIEKAERDNS